VNIQITHSSSPLILVVDDERPLRLLMRRAMEQEGYQIAEAGNGEQCLEFCQQQIPALILMDAVMPKIDGFACCSTLHSLFGDRCPPVLMITALNDKESVDRAFESGAIDYITKPIHWAVLRQRVRRVLQMQWAQQEQKRLLEELQEKIEHERFLKEALELTNRQLEQLVSIDGLTQIANRRCFDTVLQQEWYRLAREQAPLVLILCDIDFFKLYNDTYGHLAGDECLRRVGKILHTTIRRPADMAARYGGEEFALILPNTHLEGAIHVVEMIQANLAKAAIAHAGSQVSTVVTLSMGLAGTIPTPGNTPIDLIAQADQALYQSKSAGRNRWCVYQSES